MKVSAAKLLATVCCSLTLLGAGAAPSEACFFLDCLFGCCGGGCRGGGYPAYYGPSYGGGCSTGSCGTATYYAPMGWGGCNTCGPVCGPYGGACASGGCASGDCSTGLPTANDQWNSKSTPEPTYAKPDGGSSGSGGAARGQSDDPARTRGKTGLDENDARPGNLQDGEDSTNRAFKSPAASAGDIEQTSGAEDASGEPTKIQPKKGADRPAPGFPTDDDTDTGAGKLPKLNLDGKIASRPAPERRRLTREPRLSNARLVRIPAYPKGAWTPVEPESNVARK